MNFDDSTNLTSLEMEWASKSNLEQRKGRAGRVSAGFCYRLIRKNFFKKFHSYPRPQVEKEPLDKLILSLKRFKMLSEYKLTDILALLLTQPTLDNIERTVLRLKEAGALSIYKDGEHCDFDGDLTFMGSVMGQLPCDIKLGKLILLGHAFGRLREAIIIASALSVKSIFKRLPEKELDDYIAKLKSSQELFCDFNLIINVYNLWVLEKERLGFAKNQVWVTIKNQLLIKLKNN